MYTLLFFFVCYLFSINKHLYFLFHNEARLRRVRSVIICVFVLSFLEPLFHSGNHRTIAKSIAPITTCLVSDLNCRLMKKLRRIWPSQTVSFKYTRAIRIIKSRFVRTGSQASPRRHSSVDELYGLVNSSQSLTTVNGQRQRSLSDSGPRDESAQSNGKSVRREFGALDNVNIRTIHIIYFNYPLLYSKKNVISWDIIDIKIYNYFIQSHNIF